MDADVEEEFRAAAEYVRQSKVKVTNEQKLELYAHFKQVRLICSGQLFPDWQKIVYSSTAYAFFFLQATEGHCTAPKPSYFDMVGRSKW